MLGCFQPVHPSQTSSVMDIQYGHGDTQSAQHELMYYLRQYGSTIMAYSALQKGLSYFLIKDVGYIAYAMRHIGPLFLSLKEPVALGDPVCHPKDRAKLAAAFLLRYPKALFIQTSKDFALVLRSMGMKVNSMGGETELDLKNYSFSGHAKRGLRSAISAAQKDGVQVEELGKLTPQLIAEMKDVDKAWVEARGNHAGRVWFINRLPVFEDEEGVRLLAARDSSGRMLAFLACDPVYEAGQVVGYYANVTRMRPDAHPGTLNLIMKEFLDRLRTEEALAAPSKKLSEKKSLKKKKAEKAAAQALAAAAGTTTKAAAAAAATTKPGAAAAAMAKAGAALEPRESCCEDSPPDASYAGSDQEWKQQQQLKQPAGVRFVSLGLSPFHQLKDGEMKHSKAVARVLKATYERGNVFYPYKAVALSKAKYGAGLHDGVYEDPNVTYRMTYLCHTHSRVASLTLFDLGVFLGFWSNPADALLTLLKSKAKEARVKGAKERTAKQQHKVLSQRLAQCSAASSTGSQASKNVELDESDQASSSSGSSSQDPVKIRLVVPKAKAMEFSEAKQGMEVVPKFSKVQQ